MLISCRQGSKGRSAAGKAVVLNYITTGGAVGVNYSTVGKSSRSQLAAGGSSRSQLAVGRAARVSQLLIKQQGLVNCRQGSKGLFCWRWEQQKLIVVLQVEQ